MPYNAEKARPKNYQKQVDKLKEYGITLLTTLKEFKNANKTKLKFKCSDENHPIIDNLTGNLISTKIRGGYHPCTNCQQDSMKDKSLASRLEKKLTELEHKFDGYDKKTRLVKFVCKCGNENEVHGSNIMRDGWMSCLGCHNQRRDTTKKYEDVKKYFEEQGCVLLSKSYQRNTDHLDYICGCKDKTVGKTTWKDFSHGKRCQKCKLDKFMKTCMEKYGVSNVIQNKTIFARWTKSSLRGKKFIFPSGKEVKVLGYEPSCIKELLTHYNEEDIITDPELIPIISYKKQYINKSGKLAERNSVYFPDIQLPDRLVEVKSTYTLQIDIDNIIRKIEACNRDGHNLELWIFKSEKELMYRIHFYADKSRPNLWFEY